MIISKGKMKEKFPKNMSSDLIKFAKEGCTMIEIPTTYKARKYGRPKLRRFKSGIEIFSTIFRGLMDAGTIRKCQENWKKKEIQYHQKQI